MKNEAKGDQIGRVLKIYSKLSDGYVVNKAEEAELYGVNERSIRRDIDHIRSFLDEEAERTGIVNTIVYDRIEKGYRLETLYKIRLQNSEVLALCKILLDSRAFVTAQSWTEQLRPGALRSAHSSAPRAATSTLSYATCGGRKSRD